MNKNKCDITVVLDRSGSMASIASDMCGGFDKFIELQKKGTGEAFLTLVQFDIAYDFVYHGLPIANVPPLQLQPRGATALIDAVGRAITETGKRLSEMPEHERPGKVVFMVITDGEENSSKEFTKAQLKEKIEHQQAVYKWEFVFLGANQDAFAEAGGLGILQGGIANYKPTHASIYAAFAMTGQNMQSFRAGATENMAYSAQQREDIEQGAPPQAS